jgi:hypothetical protein
MRRWVPRLAHRLLVQGSVGATTSTQEGEMQASVTPIQRVTPDELELARFDRDNFEFVEIRAMQKRQDYIDLLEATYRMLGFLEEFVYPKPDAVLFELTFREELAGICALTPAAVESSLLDLIPGGRKNGHHARVLELTNVIVVPSFHGSIALGLLLYGCAYHTWRNGYDFVAGIVREEVLRAFVDFGVVPVDHAPLHLLGRDDLNDFAIYYDTRSPESIVYMHERTQRYCNQKHILRAIELKYLHRPTRRWARS